MLSVLVDTCVWLDVAKDYRHRPMLQALEQMAKDGSVKLVVPRQVLDEFMRNRERVIKESGKSLSSTFKRVKEAVRQFGKEDEKKLALISLDDVDHRITILGEAVNESVSRIEKLFAKAEVIETSDDVLLRASRRGVENKAPFHKGKNSIGDAILIELYRDLLGDHLRSPGNACSFVTHNKHDFSDMNGDDRLPHPDIADLFKDNRSIYALALGEVLNQHAPDLMEEVRWEFEYQDEPRLLSEILDAENLLFRQIWYNRHWNLRTAIDSGAHKLVSKSEWDKAMASKGRRHEKMTLDSVWTTALAAAKKTEEEVGLENLGPWNDFEWGMLNGKLSALRWVLGSEWDFLDT